MPSARCWSATGLAQVRLTAALGLAATIAFVVLRALAVYGDPVPFRLQETAARNVMAFLNCQKYPPSLLYTLMTLGPGLLVLAGLDATEGAIATHGRRAGAVRRALVTLGRVPLFYYLLQWPVIHILVIDRQRAGRAARPLGDLPVRRARCPPIACRSFT